MAMEKISGSSLPRQGALDGSRQSERTGQDQQPVTTAGDKGVAGSRAGAGDTLEISATAHRMMDLREAVAAGRLALNTLPDVRSDRVAQARERLQNGFYDSAEVRERTAAGVAAALRSLAGL